MQNVRDNVRLRTTPIPVQRTTRAQMHRVLTSSKAGKFLPVLAVPLLREDSLAGARFHIGFEMMETVEVLMNAVNARVRAVLVPKLAYERFDGFDSLNKSYKELPPIEGAPVVPWFETMAAPDHGENEILLALGKHAKPGELINTEYIEAYNLAWNWLAKNRSPDITLRDRLDTDLAPAFWAHQGFAHIVPDFDQAIIDGEVALSVANARMPVKGIGLTGAVQSGTPDLQVRVSGDAPGTSTQFDYGVLIEDPDKALVAGRQIAGVSVLDGIPQIYAELADTGVTLSLANFDLARKTQAFANLRRQFNGHSDEYIIDLLMSGISIPEQAWKNPITLYDQTVQFGMSKRYASDSGNLTESVVNGMTGIEVRFSCPRVPCGGVIMMFVEFTPEQLFERQKDPYMHATTVDVLPDFLRDTLDPEKVSVVRNDEVDIDHDTPTHTFGYAPLNHEWVRSMPQIGGKFYRPEVDAGFDEDRQRIWAVETQNPVLSEDFYLCTTMHAKPFVVTNQDQFEVLVRGDTAIRGNTVFGGRLIEATDDYEKVMSKAPMERIDKDATPTP